ncbi:MAG: class I SAM-dependent methyltransferase [Planctomycetes bacterium]|nr:class I SAM-dependent methyltransferase [Planctomycetota bacterium]
MEPKSLLHRLLYLARDWRSRAVFRAIREHCRGEVLDVGGWDFYVTAVTRGARFDRWTTLEVDQSRLLVTDDPRVTVVHGDGCGMTFPDASFDTVLNLQVLEHVFEPIRMVHEIARVLRPGGHAIFLVPTTSTMHLAPHYHYNFSRFWIEEVMRRANLEIVELRPLGGVWSSSASHALFYFLQAFRTQGMSDRRIRRPFLFYLLFPVQALWALVSIPIGLVLGLGDLAEEPNNHLVVVRSRTSSPIRSTESGDFFPDSRRIGEKVT